MLHQRGEALHPVAVIAIQNAVHFAHFRLVDMAADHAVVIAPPGFIDDHLFIGGNEGNGVLHLMLEIL